MFALFLTGACTVTVSILATPLSIYTRWLTLPIALLAFAAALTTTVATAIATIMFIIFRNVIIGALDTVNIVPTIGLKMFAFMWIASACAIVGWLVQMGMCCCCASRRDVRLGKKRGRGGVWRERGEVAPVEMKEKKKKKKKGEGRGLFGRKKV